MLFFFDKIEKNELLKVSHLNPTTPKKLLDA